MPCINYSPYFSICMTVNSSTFSHPKVETASSLVISYICHASRTAKQRDDGVALTLPATGRLLHPRCVSSSKQLSLSRSFLSAKLITVRSSHAPPRQVSASLNPRYHCTGKSHATACRQDRRINWRWQRSDLAPALPLSATKRFLSNTGFMLSI